MLVSYGSAGRDEEMVINRSVRIWQFVSVSVRVCHFYELHFSFFFHCFSFLFCFSRIKTNGSLPRNETRRSVQSPNGTTSAGRNLNTSEDELSGIFTFDPTPNSVPASPSLSNHQQQTVAADLAVSCKSPYENVCMPQSPRTRIRTTVGKNKEDSPESLSTNQHTYQLITSGVAAEVFPVV